MGKPTGIMCAAGGRKRNAVFLGSWAPEKQSVGAAPPRTATAGELARPDSKTENPSACNTTNARKFIYQGYCLYSLGLSVYRHGRVRAFKEVLRWSLRRVFVLALGGPCPFIPHTNFKTKPAAAAAGQRRNDSLIVQSLRWITLARQQQQAHSLKSSATEPALTTSTREGNSKFSTAYLNPDMSDVVVPSFFPTPTEIAGGLRWVRQHPVVATAAAAAATAVSVLTYLKAAAEDERQLELDVLSPHKESETDDLCSSTESDASTPTRDRNLSPRNLSCYIAPNEPLPYRSSPNKRYIGKMMFLTTAARSRYKYRKKKKHLMMRHKGDLVAKNVKYDESPYVKMLNEKGFPAIREKWPGHKARVIQIQQDNAGPHVSPYRDNIVQVGELDGWRIEMTCQSPTSPDMNVLDLGNFNALQAIQYRNDTKNLDALIDAVNSEIDNISPSIIDNSFVTLQMVIQCVIEQGRENHYKIPRVFKHCNSGSTGPVATPISTEVVENGYRLLSSTKNKTILIRPFSGLKTYI
ncbi:hypothetical protein ON010_g12 [Phytophthora cinnamomi]|nr:hypothetical protein ON010_g12 [Phytophthora cinnamomi]